MGLNKQVVSYLNPVLMDSRELEQTQEIRIPDGMPDVDRVLGVWGQPVLRSKEWHRDTASFSGGIMLWVLYRPEGEGIPQTMDAWIPFQGKWDLPEDIPEGTLSVCLGVRFLDARVISPRKMMTRAGLSVCVQAFSDAEREVTAPENLPEDVHLLQKSYPLRLYAQAGEKAFSLEDTLSSAGEDLSTWRIAAAGVRPYLNDQKVVGNKLAFRGGAELTILLLPEDGIPESRSFQFPFSQLAELEDSFGNNADSEIQLCVTNLELEEDAEGQKKFRLSLTAQYTVSDITVVETVEDAYSNLRSVKLTTESLELMPILDKRWESIPARATLPEDITNSLAASIWSDVPAFEESGEEGTLCVQGTGQILFQGEANLEGKTLRFEGSRPFRAGAETRKAVTAFLVGPALLEPGAGGMELTGEMKCLVTVFAAQGIPLVTELELGELREPDPDRPALVLCRPGEKTLWALAKENGSTVEAIRRANNLEGDAAPNQVLLIPIA